MQGKLKKKGTYELFETTRGNTILNLEDRNFFALVKGQLGDIIVYSNPDHEKKSTLAKGRYYYVDFKDDPEFSDMPHVFLKDGAGYRELVLPQGLPNRSNKRKKLVRTRDNLPAGKVNEHVKGRGNKGSLKKYEDKPEGLRNKTKEELYRLARKHNITGRSKMNKEELVKKLKDRI